jgi:hypothetical protein
MIAPYATTYATLLIHCMGAPAVTSRWRWINGRMPSYYSEKADSNSADNAGTARKQLLFEPLFLD